MIPIPLDYRDHVRTWFKWISPKLLKRSNRAFPEIRWMTLEEDISADELIRTHQKDLFTMMIYKPLMKFELNNMMRMMICPSLITEGMRNLCFHSFLNNFTSGGWFIGCEECFKSYYNN